MNSNTNYDKNIYTLVNILSVSDVMAQRSVIDVVALNNYALIGILEYWNNGVWENGNVDY